MGSKPERLASHNGAKRDVSSFAEALSGFPDRTALASAMGVPYPTVVAWQRRDSIPQEYWRGLALAARDLGVKGITLQSLALCAECKSERRADKRRSARSSLT